MSESQNEIAVSLKELQQVCDAINGGADYFESQLVSSSQLADVTESVKGYAAEVLQTATQHLVNMAELTEEMMLQQSTTIGQLRTHCSSILQDSLTQRAKLESLRLSALQVQLPLQP